MNVQLDLYQTLAAAGAVYIAGRFLKLHFSVFEKFCIPSAVVGGVLFAILNCLLSVSHVWRFHLDGDVLELGLILFFSSMGYMVSGKMVRKGGNALFQGSRMVIKMALLVLGLILLQNFVGILSAKIFGLPSLFGLISGSIPLVGSFGTAGAFGPVLERLGVQNAVSIGFEAATFGMIAGSILGGPIGENLIFRHHLLPSIPEGAAGQGTQKGKSPEKPLPVIHFPNFMSGFVQLLIAMGFGTFVSHLFAVFDIIVPAYIGAMISAIIIRNTGEYSHLYTVYPDEIHVLGTLFLNIFLSCALMQMNLWQQASLFLPLMATLLIQTLLVAGFAYFIVFKAMGSDYDAAIMASGICGFTMGALPNAVANMNALCERFGPAPIAYFVIPLIGAFVVDFFNMTTIMILINLLK